MSAHQSSITLENLNKLAKKLKRQQPEMTLQQAQDTVARQHGFDSFYVAVTRLGNNVTPELLRQVVNDKLLSALEDLRLEAVDFMRGLEWAGVMAEADEDGAMRKAVDDAGAVLEQVYSVTDRRTRN